MPFDRFLIGPINTGLQTDLRPWQITEDAFPELNNAYVFRGRVRKRFGSTWMGLTDPNKSRLRIALQGGAGVGTLFGGIVTGTVPGSIFGIGQSFAIGNIFFTVTNPAAGPQQMLRTDGSVAPATFNITNGAYNITGVALPNGTQAYFFPSQPVMGLAIYEVGPINNQPSFAWDTQFAYQYVTGAWERELSGTPLWHGTNLNFFWVTNWDGITPNQTRMFVSNFFVVNPNGAGNANDDPIWYYDVTAAPQWAVYAPTFTHFAPNGGASNTGPFIKTARIILPFKDRLVLLNTIENDGGGAGGTNTQFKNRARFSHNGSPFARNAWYEPNQTDNDDATPLHLADGGGFVDASTEEQIISAEFIKDRLIVFFERSTWELAYTGNQVLPFVWQKINTELGCESTFSSVPFDKAILAIGNTGVHACNGANVERIDNKIPDQIFEIKDKNESVKRVVGIRDYFTELVYWTFPSTKDPSLTYPNQVFVYNYRNGTWAFNDDTFTFFGYFEQQLDIIWSSAIFEWQETDFSWNSGINQAQFRQVIGGNQQGFVVILNPTISRNAADMQITNIVPQGDGTALVTIIDHSLHDGDFITIENAVGIVSPLIVKVFVIDANTIGVFADSPITGTYLGGGVSARVSVINILTKQFNPYVDKARNVFIQKIDFCVLKTSTGQVTVDYYPSSSNVSMLIPGVIQGNGVLETSPYALYPLENEQQRLWHPVYFQTSGEFVQFRITMTDEQMFDDLISFEDFELEGMVLYTKPTAARLE